MEGEMKNDTQPNHLLPPSPCIASSLDWCRYYERNDKDRLQIPWERGGEITDAERDAISASLAAWQLGETSEGTHLLAAARNYATRIGDSLYVEAVTLFIREEQRHGSEIGRFLDLAGVPRLRKNWGDSLFRGVRYFMPTMEVWTTPVVMVETLAMVYYNSVRKATGSAVLQTLCRQILRDEVKHLRFQCERLAILLSAHPKPVREILYRFMQVCFAIVATLVWMGHRKVFRAGGHTFRTYWREAWARMNYGWERVRPERYGLVPVTLRRSPLPPLR
jgi:hypothetical protein